jgi:pyrimidine deaminase RibD-like protein
MKFSEFSDDDYTIENHDKLDRILLELCFQILKGLKDDPIKYGMVAACVLDPKNRTVFCVNEATEDGTRKHAERVAIERYVEKYGDIPKGSIIVTTLSPCNEDDTDMAKARYGDSCTDLINSSNVRKVYCGYMDPSQHNDHPKYTLEETSRSDIKELCKSFADTFLKDKHVDENFADGKNPQDKGDSKRHGVPTKASVSTLRKVAKQGGRKGQLAHWMANMKSGKAKKK